MSSRTNVTLRTLTAFPEVGASTKSEENADVTNGNKLQQEPDIVVVFRNSSAAPKTITYTYDDDAGEVRTKVLTLAVGEIVAVQFESRLCRHASDAAENGSHVWFTASGVAGDIKMFACRMKRALA